MSSYISSPDSQNPDTANGLTEQPKKKKRTLGNFQCPDCDKIFTRSDHLARHHLNHKPKELFECEVLLEGFGGSKHKCGKTFVRKDLKERHVRRHAELLGLVDPNRVVSSISKSLRGSITSQSSVSESSNLTNTYQPHSSLQVSNLIHDTGPTTHYNVLPPAIGSDLAHGRNSTDIHAFPGGRTNGSLQPQGMVASQMNEIYEQLPNFNSNIPQTQNDILSWLFTESPPDMISPPGKMIHEHQKRESFNKSNNNTYANNSNLSPQVPINARPYESIGAGQIPSPYDNPQFSPLSNQLQQPAVPNQTPIEKGELLAPFYHINNVTGLQSMNSYGMQDVSIFSNVDNPLDEVFLRSYQAQSENGNNPNSASNLKLSVCSTGSSNSPATTNESITSPILTSDIHNSPKSNEQQNSAKKQEKQEKSNVQNNKHIYIDITIMNSLLDSLPKLTRGGIETIFQHSNANDEYSIENRFSRYLSVYWSIFHPQFTILHKPSFDTKVAEPLLLLSMIIIGCSYYASSDILTDTYPLRKKSPEFKLSSTIAKPLRFMIFQHEDFKSPVKLWILQSLNMLEWCEKNFLLRRMHERGHIHHGTTVQLLRRSPLLGGNPTNINKRETSVSGSNTSADESDTLNEMSTENSDNTDYDLFVKWIDSESMKRVTFMTFYLDIIDHIKFRHNPQILFYQLQLLNLPCDDEHLWESAEVNGSFRKIVKRQKKLQLKSNHERKNTNIMKRKKEANGNIPIKIKNGESFLNVLKKLLRPFQNPTNPETKADINLSLFTRKILFAGLVSIMYQMQQSDLQNNSSLLSSESIEGNKKGFKIWKEILTKAFDNWNLEINGTCCSGKFKLHSNMSDIFAKFQCQFPLYHLTQIIGMADINHYDIAIFGGSPANMSVSATMKDHYTVQNKLNKIWLRGSKSTKTSVNDLINLKSIIHCYLLLWELMLKPTNVETTGDEFLEWDVDNDYFDGMYAVGIATLVLWSFVFSTCGVESQRFDEVNDVRKISSENYKELVELSAEGAYEYMHRIRQEFLTNLRKDNLHNEYNIHPFKLNNRISSPHEIIKKYCELLPIISNKQNISGLCFLVGTKLLNSQWDIIRENGKLILNCGLRSIGKKNVLCLDLFDNELED